ncbi:TonB-dependent receptor [Arundinibacter roseus]|uniref:TonB-dependent receptor n=1 Tax=Arundinibacter roseus TaxID=2070510 RepID=A0A4R4K4C8_9BACT|nr:TonB-dependent receptor [Arundinibacter roseus]TDB62274.1 TonB-dependent receptor [Arundinibacter roseus]
MKTLFTSLLFATLLSGFGGSSLVYGQVSKQQVVRGQLRDAVSQSPVVGATVVVVGSSPLVGTTTDSNGNFRLSLALGRATLKITYTGYEEVLVPDVVINAGKEVILDLSMTEAFTSLNEVTVTYNRNDDPTVANNEMATVSTRSFSPSETLRYAGSLGDPSRMAANFAGVSGANDARNDIVVRGNSPASVLWRLDGVNIPNPNHFGALGTSGGPVSMLNTNLLAKSDFMSGAFPAEYANALGSVFDLRLRKGNDEKYEYLAQIAFNGVEVGAEGPYSKKSKASFLANYRYSLFGLMSNIGFEIAGTPYYQDFTFKTDVPIGKKGNLSAWVIGGKSRITFLGEDVDTETGDAYGEENTNTRVNYETGMAAVSYEHRFSNKTVGKIVFSASRTFEGFEGDTVIYAPDSKVVLHEIESQNADFTNEKMSVNASFAHKISARSKLSGGVILDFNRYNLQDKQLYPTQLTTRNSDGQTLISQAYVQWKYRLSQALTLNTGMTGMHYELNNSAVLEPRIGFSYALNSRSALNVAYGLHSNLQPLLLYNYQTQNPDGTYSLTNKDMGFTRSHHFVTGYERNLSASIRLKVEAYYQSLFNVPISSTPNYYSVLVEGANFAPTNQGNLVNEGTGRNYGVEMTLEKSFSKGYYFLLTTSLFDSKYKGSDGVERNTPFNSHYVVNVLAGKEIALGRNGLLSLNWKLTSTGGRYIRPIDLAASEVAGRAVYNDANAFLQQQSGYFRTDFKVGYKLNRPHATHEIAIDLQNFTNNQNVFQQAYNPRTNRIGTAYQQGFLPIPFYRLTF